MQERAALVEQILALQHRLMHCLLDNQQHPLLAVDLTMPQLKAVLIVVHQGGATGGQLARGLGVTLSTVTGIVDRLHDQGLVTREEDAEDRRVTRVVATAAGQDLVDQLDAFRRERMSRLLGALDTQRLRAVAEAFTYIVDAAPGPEGAGEPNVDSGRQVVAARRAQ